MDPLSVLKSSFANSRSVEVDGDKVLISNQAFDGQIPTAWRAERKTEHYNLLQLAGLYQYISQDYQAYIREVIKHKTLGKPVSRLDFNAICSYLKGEIDNHHNIHLQSDCVYLSFEDSKKKRSRSENGDSVITLEEVLERECPLNDRHKFMLCHKNFDGVLKILKEIKREVDAHKRELDRKRYEEEYRRQMRTQARETNRYDRKKDERQVWTEYLGAQDGDVEMDLQTNQFGFNMEEFNRTGQVVQGLGKTGTDETEPGQIPEPPKHPPMSSRMMLYGAHRSKPVEKHPPRPKHSSSQPHKPHHKHQHHSHSKPPSKHHQQPNQLRPIIMVPPGTRSIINIINAADFFGEGILVPWEAKQNDVSKRKDKVRIARSIGLPANSKEQVYTIMEDPKLLNPREFKDRVIACVVSGANWQFRDFPDTISRTKDPVEIFSKIAGFYIDYEDATDVSENISKWNVKRINVNRVNRHKDRVAAMAFWESVDKFLAAKRHRK